MLHQRIERLEFGVQGTLTVTASLAERVYSDIIDGQHAPGARLKLIGLAERHGAGQTADILLKATRWDDL